MATKQGFIVEISEETVLISRSDRTTFAVERRQVPEEAKTGDFIVENRDHFFEIDQEITRRRELEIRQMSETSCN